MTANVETTADDHADRLEALAARRADSSRSTKVKQRTHYWMRWAHVYLSMFALLVTLFFGLTGITLNHPGWTFGDDGSTSSVSGTLPPTVVVDGDVEFLLVSEFLRSEHGVRGDVDGFDVVDGEASIAYKGLDMRPMPSSMLPRSTTRSTSARRGSWRS